MLVLRVANASPRATWWVWRNYFVHFHSMDWSGPLEIGPGLELPHPLGTCLIVGARVGENVGIGHNVTLGGGAGGERPVIGDRVTLFPGAVIVGGVVIGHDSVVSANCVVQRDVPPSRVVTQRGLIPIGATSVARRTRP